MRDTSRHEHAARIMQHLIRAEQDEARQRRERLTVQQAVQRLRGGGR